MIPNEPWYFGKNDTDWYFVPVRLKDVFRAWANMPCPGADATDAEWDAYEVEPEGIVRSLDPSSYVIEEAHLWT